LVYAARHYRELSAQNELRPQDVMRILAHVHAYGEPAKVPSLVVDLGQHIREQINQREHDQIERLEVEYGDHATRLAKLESQLAEAQVELGKITNKTTKDKVEAVLAKLEGQRDKAVAKIAERNEKIAEARRRAEEDRHDVEQVGTELGALYGDSDELSKHTRVVGLDEIEENEFNLNIPRYVDTFEPEPRVEVKDALKALNDAEVNAGLAEAKLIELLESVGYVTR
jgi:type I restriction enzyme M protein